MKLPDDQRPSTAIRLGVASYLFGKFGQADVIKFMHLLNTPYLNVKDVQLPMTPADAVKPTSAKYRDTGITLTAAGTIYFTQDDGADIRTNFEYMKAAGTPLFCRRIRHHDCHPQSRTRGQVLPSLDA